MRRAHSCRGFRQQERQDWAEPKAEAERIASGSARKAVSGLWKVGEAGRRELRADTGGRGPTPELARCACVGDCARPRRATRHLVPSGDAVPEFEHPAAERSPDLGQSLRAENEQHIRRAARLPDSDESRQRYCPRLAGSTLAKVRKSFIRNGVRRRSASASISASAPGRKPGRSPAARSAPRRRFGRRPA